MDEHSLETLWNKYKNHLIDCRRIGLALDVSRMNFSDSFLAEMKPALRAAFASMTELENGAIANIDENRMVGHYWLRNAKRAPSSEITEAIDSNLDAIKTFVKKIRRGEIKSQNEKKFTDALIIGIGGSALGPQFVSSALGSAKDRLTMHFFDNTDPDGMDRVLERIGKSLSRTLTVVISKSGGTKETRNGMLITQAAYAAKGMDFGRHAVAVTGSGSELDHFAQSHHWIARFPMWDWVGGRTSELSAVGLLPAALQGIDIDGMLKGARDADAVTRKPDLRENPAAMLALMWYYIGGGKGQKDMVILPYKDRLMLLSKYLQQLVMESLGKQLDRSGQVVNQGIAVYGNKGSTDQHAYVQQLREGVNNFFVTFIEVLKSSAMEENVSMAEAVEVEPGIHCGDYLSGFYQGTRSALYENGRESITLTIDEVTPRAIGVLIAVFERAVGLYAELININAYHQPGVEAGKKAASAVIALHQKVMSQLRAGTRGTAEQIASAIGEKSNVETVFHILRRLAANPGRKVMMTAAAEDAPITESVFGLEV